MRSYDRWPWQHWYLSYLIEKARTQHQDEAFEESCRQLRDLLARQAVIGLHGKERISVQQACAMTASELEQLVGKADVISDIRELDRQLITGEYGSMP